ncbi:hypothetical protein JCM1841_006658 [Sporobolomyces salmonicolor]
MAATRLQLYGIVSTTLFVWTVLNAFRQRSNLYAAAVYLSKSNACMMILWNQGIYQTVLFGKFLQAVFFGELRLIEVERLQERGWFAVTETLLALTIFKDEFESSFVLLFVSLLFLKVFHWLASDRVEMMEQAAHVSRLAHARMIGLLSLLWLVDLVLFLFSVNSILLDGPTVMIMFASEYMILLAGVWSTTMKYGINCIDMRREVPWEDKSIYVFYVELAADFFKLVTYLSFFGLILTFYGLPLNILRDVYLTLRSFLLKIRSLRRYRQATRNMDVLYPNATREEMAQMRDRTCIICREDMEYRPAHGEAEQEPAQGQHGDERREGPPEHQQPRVGSNDAPKKLPCGHVFHFHCLRSWLERQQSCPTCRRPVLPQEQQAPPPAAAAAAQAGAAGARAAAQPGAVAAANPNVGDEALRQAQINLARNLGREAFGVIFPGVPFPPEAGPAGVLLPPPNPNAPPIPPPVPPHLRAPNTPHTLAAQDGAAVPPPATRTVPTAASPLSPSGATASSPPGATNPLARFNLPNLQLPQTGEAGLYHSPPSFAGLNLGSTSPSLASPSAFRQPTAYPGFADVAYGAYPQFGRTSGVPPPAGAPQGRSIPNLEERIKHIRERLARATGEAASGSSSAPSEHSNSATPVQPNGRTSEQPKEEPPSEPKADKGKGKENPIESDEAKAEVEDEGEGNLTPREAALRAAVRRLGKHPAHPSLPPSSSSAFTVQSVSATPRPPAPRPPSCTALRKTDTPAPWVTAAVETPLPPSRAPSPTLPPFSSSSSKAEPVLGEELHPRLSTVSPPDLPRLIPLFDPTNPSASFYPSLLSHLSSSSTLSTQPLIPAAPTGDQLSELDQLARHGIEERLRLVLGFQSRLEGLADEMRSALRAAPLSSARPEDEVVGGATDKGKQPLEGERAVGKVDGMDGERKLNGGGSEHTDV